MELFELQYRKEEKLLSDLSESEIASIVYHNIFDYPLTFGELIKWQAGKKVKIKLAPSVHFSKGHFFLENSEASLYKKNLRARLSDKKMVIAKKAAKVLKILPLVKGVMVTGALAMRSADSQSDIDLMIVTSKGKLWTTRLLSYVTLRIFGFSLRKPKDKNQKDKLCLNIWLDESDPTWARRDRNIYSAHEIAQVIPLVNKEHVYEKFLIKNKWILDYWPKAVKIKSVTTGKKDNSKKRTDILEKILFKVQRLYMTPKVTREVVTPTRALFHPADWSKIILGKLTS